MLANKCYIEVENEKSLRNLTGETMSVSIHLGNKYNDIEVMTVAIEKTSPNTFTVVATAEETRETLEITVDVDSEEHIVDSETSDIPPDLTQED